MADKKVKVRVDVETNAEHADRADVAERRPEVVAPARHLELVPGHVHPDRNDRQHQQRSGHEPPESAGPETGEADAPVAAPFDREQTRDQEAREHEEQVDAQESAAQAEKLPVVPDDGQHGDGPQAVEGGNVAEAPRRGRRLSQAW